MSVYHNGLALHISDATEAGRRRLASSGPGLLVRLGSFVLAVAEHRVTAWVVVGAGCWGLIYMGLRMVFA